MHDITEDYKNYTEWYFNQMDTRPVNDDDKNWLVVDCAMQIFGQGKSGGLLLYCGGDLSDLSMELLAFKMLGLSGFENALRGTIANRDESHFDEYFYSHCDELFLAAYKYSIDNDLYKE